MKFPVIYYEEPLMIRKTALPLIRRIPGFRGPRSEFETMVQNTQRFLLSVAKLKSSERVFILYDTSEKKQELMADVIQQAVQRLGNPLRIHKFGAFEKLFERFLGINQNLIATAVHESKPCLFINLMRPANGVIAYQQGRIRGTEHHQASRIVSFAFAKAEHFLWSINYNKMQRRAGKIVEALTDTDSIRITTPNGTDLTLSIKGRKVQNEIEFNNPGSVANFPAGEVFVSIIETSAHGTLVIDGTLSFSGIPPSPIIIEIEAGKAILSSIRALNPSPESEEMVQVLIKMLQKHELSVIAAELGIGVADYPHTGDIATDEKRFGTAHIAFGSNINMGGQVDCPSHHDCVILNPTIEATKTDGKIVNVLVKGSLPYYGLI